MWSSIQVLPNQVNTVEDIDFENSMQSYIKKPSENFGRRLNLKVRNQFLLSSSELISAVFCTVIVYRKKSTFIKVQNQPLPKDIGKKLFIVK